MILLRAFESLVRAVQSCWYCFAEK